MDIFSKKLTFANTTSIRILLYSVKKGTLTVHNDKGMQRKLGLMVTNELIKRLKKPFNTPIGSVVLFLALLFLNPSVYATLPDSLMTIDKVYEMSVKNPNLAHTIIKEMRADDSLPSWLLDRYEGDCYVNQRLYRLAFPVYVSALNNPGIRKEYDEQMFVLSRLVGISARLMEYDELTNYMHRLEELATEKNSEYYLSYVQFFRGKLLNDQGNPAGLPTSLKALDMLDRCEKTPMRAITKVYFCYELVYMYKAIGRFADALKMSFLYEKSVNEIPANYTKRLYIGGLRQVYALRASIYADMGRQREADACYARWKTLHDSAPADDKEILGYLMSSEKLDEASVIINSYKNYLVEEGDSISHWMLFIQGQEAILLSLQEKYKEAAEVYEEMNQMANNLHRMRSKELVDTTNQLLDQQKMTHQRNLWINTLIIATIFLIFVILMFVFYARIIRKRNKVLKTIIYGLDAYRYAALKDGAPQNDILQADTSQTPSEMPSVASERNEKNPDETGKNNEISSLDDRQLFVEMDKKVTRDRLFLNPNLDRESLMALVKVDKNRFGRMISRYSETSNASSYISAKRAEYAAELLKQYPDYTIAAIAEMCGMSNTVTFNRTFKNIYGVTPSDYRKTYYSEFNGGNF